MKSLGHLLVRKLERGGNGFILCANLVRNIIAKLDTFRRVSIAMYILFLNGKLLLSHMSKSFIHFPSCMVRNVSQIIGQLGHLSKTNFSSFSHLRQTQVRPERFPVLQKMEQVN